MKKTRFLEVRAPIFLICSERSGSNLISSIMGMHSQIYAHPPYHMGRDILLNLPFVFSEGTSSRSWDIISKRAVKRIRKHRNDVEADSLKNWLAQRETIDAREIARFIFQQLPADADGKHAFVKENNIQHLLYFFADCFPEAKFVFQVRDPRDFLASAKARKTTWLGNKFGSFHGAMKIWNEDQLCGLRALTFFGPDRVKLIRYEDLIGQNTETLEAVCQFLGLPFEEEMLNFHESDSSRKLATKGGPRENIGKPLITDNFNKYRNSLSKKEIKSVEARVGYLMDMFGYERDFPAGAVKNSGSVLGAVVSEQMELLANKQLKDQFRFEPGWLAESGKSRSNPQ